MKCEMIRLHLLIIFLLLLVIKSSFGIECRRDPQDSSSCTFNDVGDSRNFYGKLINLTDGNKQKIKKIRIINSYMDNIPKELTESYKNVEDLDATSLRLCRLINIDFVSDNSLRKLNVSFNKIHWLKTGLPKGLKKLENLDLSHNNIDLIDDDAFEYNSNFKYLNMSHNQINKLSAKFFDAIRSVKILHLNNNRISSITGDVSSIKMELDELYLNNNELTSFAPVLVKQANILDLSKNNLQGEITFAETKLSELNIRSNSLKNLAINDKLKKLDASDNLEHTFSVSFGINTLLTHVSLSNLEIVDYDELLKNLAKLHNIEYLDLSQNNLELFCFKEHQLSASLKILNLRHTDLHTLGNWRDLKGLLPNLQELDIQENFFNCTELPQMLKSFQKIKLNITGLSNGNESEFLIKNCGSGPHRKRKLAENEYFGIDTKIRNIIGIVLFIVYLLEFAVICILLF